MSRARPIALAVAILCASPALAQMSPAPVQSSAQSPTTGEPWATASQLADVKEELKLEVAALKEHHTIELGSTKELLLSILAEHTKQYNARFDEIEKNADRAVVNAQTLIRAQFDAQKEAVIKAEMANEKRLESVNEFRGQLKDQQITLLPRSEADVRFKSLETQVAALQLQQSRDQGQWSGINVVWVMLLGVGGLIISVFMLIINRKQAHHSIIS